MNYLLIILLFTSVLAAPISDLSLTGVILPLREVEQEHDFLKQFPVLQEAVDGSLEYAKLKAEQEAAGIVEDSFDVLLSDPIIGDAIKEWVPNIDEIMKAEIKFTVQEIEDSLGKITNV